MGYWDNSSNSAFASWRSAVSNPSVNHMYTSASSWWAEEARFDQGSAHEVRHTLGPRLWGHPGPWDYNVEVVYQLGTFGQGQIHAWTAASDTGYTLRTVPWQPRLGLKADIISGDRN